jgi:hypothetical protein
VKENTMKKLLSLLLEGLHGLAGSKKFQAAALSAIVWLIGKAGLHVDAQDLLPVVGPLWLFIFGQGLADFGKSAELARQAGAPAQSSSGLALPPGEGAK